MKSISLFFFLLFSSLLCNAQITDTALIKKISVNGFCLCQTTVSVLKQQYPDLKAVDVEEMDVPKECIGQDSRYIAGKGYATNKQIGIIFQKDQESDQISKIRLTKQFKGYLPNGKFVDMSKLILKDLSNLYPELKDKWGSRGCSDYWNFSNDTISFFVKIDTNKKPQFPIAEAYYMNKPIEGIDLMMSCYSLEKHDDNIIFPDESNDPIFFLDSIRVNKMVLTNFEPSEIASVTIYKDTNVIKKIFNGKGNIKNGLIYIETKDFAKYRYWNYFRSKSPEYAKLVISSKTDTTNVQYILNGKVLKNNFEGDLASIDDGTFKGLFIIDKNRLVNEYGITNKDYGVIITTIPRQNQQIKVQLK